MNQTLLTLITLFAIYGLSSFALPQRDTDPRDDLLDTQTTEISDTAVPPAEDDDTQQV